MLHILLFAALLLGPILIAWFKGDTIIDLLAARNRRRKTHKRIKATRALPVKEDLINVLLKAESQRDQVDTQIGEALATFRQVISDGRDLMAHRAAAAALDDVEQVVLARESQFANYLDVACLQSDTLDVMLEEIQLLREMAELDTKPPSPAAQHLMSSIEDAMQKRKEVDQKLHNFGTPQSEKRPNSGFDTIIG